VRALSVSLFANSKRIEQLARPLDLLTAESLSAPARHWDEVFALLGLVKEPQPFLVAGTGSIGLWSDQSCAIVKPFMGVSNKAVRAYVGSPNWVLTIENLTTFHLASQLLDGRAGLIVFTGGMPSPSWCRAYAFLLKALPVAVPAYHWGDIDQGGFRIAAYIKEKCLGDRPYLPWLMDTASLQGPTTPASDAVSNAMARSAAKAGWVALGQSMQPFCIEQEGVEVALPPFE
ncbi:MAG TPA: Wadjet anti-phage system protein JetD domain-containing protein, partial [Rubrivivax sp.]|nr:Wadjet anti-phage system protein JetD domain-containing protein [Rubrivivax sp.]